MARSLLDKLKGLEQTVSAPSFQGRREPNACAPSSGGDGETQESVEGKAAPLDPSNVLEGPFIAAGFEKVENRYGHCWRRKTTFDLLTRHGKYYFGDLLQTDFGLLSKLAKTQITPENLRFYDVETNGLGTGAGTFPFLHTIGYVQDDDLCLVQYFVDDYDAEPAVLAALADFHFNDECVIVTFNGKSFDWPLLQNRRVLHQMDKFNCYQLDLLHPSRRLWKKTIERVRLANVETSVLGVERVDDLPGSEAPTRYFQFLSDRNLDVVEPVLNHNAMDVCSLVTLQVEIARLLNGDDVPNYASTQLAIATWYDAWHDVHAAEVAYERARQADDADWRVHWLYSLFLKRTDSLTKACEIWWTLAKSFPNRVEPLIELAKYYEHKEKDLQQALQITEEALRRHLPSAHWLDAYPSLQIRQRSVDVVGNDNGRSPDFVELGLRHRLERIERKLTRLNSRSR